MSLDTAGLGRMVGGLVLQFSFIRFSPRAVELIVAPHRRGTTFSRRDNTKRLQTSGKCLRKTQIRLPDLEPRSLSILESLRYGIGAFGSRATGPRSFEFPRASHYGERHAVHERGAARECFHH